MKKELDWSVDLDVLSRDWFPEFLTAETGSKGINE